MASMVVTLLPATSEMGVTHVTCGLPSISTVHARQAPSPQPYLAPVSCRSSRRTSSRGRPGGESVCRCWPLTVKVITWPPSGDHILTPRGELGIADGRRSGRAGVVYRMKRKLDCPASGAAKLARGRGSLLEFRRIEGDVADFLALPGVGDVDFAVFGLDDGGVGVFAGVGFEV